MAVKVYPGAKNPSYEISLSDGVQTWGLRLDGGPGALQEVPLTPSTLQFTGGGTKFGDWEPGMSHIEQRTWEGGRGLEDFAEDPTRFYDSMNAWTLTPGRVLPAPQWRFAEGLRESYEHLPGSVAWKPLLEDQSYISIDFTISGADFDAYKAYLWLRRKGAPGTLTVSIYSDDGGGDPDSELANASATVTVSEITDVVSVWQAFDLSAAADLSASTKYHLVLEGASSDNAANHWEVGVDVSGEASKLSSDGSSWEQADFSLYHRVIGADLKRKFHFFELGGSLYAVDQRADGSASHLYLNGDRGKATAGGATSLTDGDKSWAMDEWQGAWVRIVAGTGSGQQREISGNTATALTVSDWDQNPDATLAYKLLRKEG